MLVVVVTIGALFNVTAAVTAVLDSHHVLASDQAADFILSERGIEGQLELLVNLLKDSLYS